MSEPQQKTEMNKDILKSIKNEAMMDEAVASAELAEQKTEEERFITDHIDHQHSGNGDVYLSMHETELKFLLSQSNINTLEEAIKIVEEYPERLRQIMPEGKLPFAIFQGKADENEKWAIYNQAIKDVLSTLQELKGKMK